MPYYVSKGATIAPLQFEKHEAKFQGIWTLVDAKGGQTPTSRENATLMMSNYFGNDWLTLVGGT